MSMPGFWEFGFLAVLALLIFGPDKLPGIARTVGRTVAQFRREAQGALDELKRAADVEELRKVGEELRGTADELRGSLTEIEREAGAAGRSATAPAAGGGQRPYGGTLAGGAQAAGSGDGAVLAEVGRPDAVAPVATAPPPPFDPDAT